MNLQITGHQIDVTPALRTYVLQKFEKIQRHFDNLIDIHVILKIDKLDQHAEATILTSGRKLFADCMHADMYAAIDGLLDKLDRQVLKHKEKLTNHHRVVEDRYASAG